MIARVARLLAVLFVVFAAAAAVVGPAAAADGAPPDGSETPAWLSDNSDYELWLYGKVQRLTRLATQTRLLVVIAIGVGMAGILVGAATFLMVIWRRRRGTPSAEAVAAPRRAGSRLERIFANGFLVIVALTVSLAVIELVGRHLLPAKELFRDVAHVRDLRVPKPYVTFGGRPNAGHLNRLGYPGPAPTADKPDSEVRIFVFGGSTVMLGEPTISARLERVLAGRGVRGVKVYNFGVAGSNATQDYARLVFEAARFKPDVVVFYNGGNDILSRAPDFRIGYPYNYLLWEANPILQSSSQGDYPALTLFLFGSTVLRNLFPDFFKRQLLKQAYSNGHSPMRDDEPGAARALAKNYARVSRDSARFADMIGAKAMVVFQPILYYKQPRTPAEAKLVEVAGGLQFGVLELAERFRHETAGLISEMRRDGRLAAVDMSGFFDTTPAGEPVYMDFIHVTEAARQRLAEAIGENLMQAFPDVLAVR